MLSPGTRLGPYEILALLGAGGMGEVYRARDTRLDRSVAIKVLPQHLSSSPEVRARFDREAKAVSSLNHPHICTLYDVGHQDGLDYLVMEHLQGESLALRLTRGPLPVPEVLRYATEIAEALDAAHRQGMVHRDLKPGNVMLTKAGAKLLDFGLARATGLSPTVSQESTSPTVTRPLTTEGAILGTFQYMAPEQLEGGETDARTDIFSFGAVLYEMVTGKKAFEGKSQASLIAAILERQPSPLTALAPAAPAALERVVQRCLAKSPDDRWQTARDLVQELRWIREDTDSGVRAAVRPARPVPKPGRLPTILAVIAGALAVVAAVLQVLPKGPPRLNPKMTLRMLQLPLTQIGYPGMSQDGKWIALPGADESGTWGLYFMNLRGGEARQVTAESSGVVTYADVSPDGSQIAYTVATPLRQELRVVPSLGGPSRILAEFASGPHWRPDGERIGYQLTGIVSQSSTLELWSVRPDGTDQRLEYRDTLCTGADRISFAWSPDGRKIAWLRSFDNERRQELVIRDLASGKERQLTRDGKNIDEVWWTRQKEIVFSSNRGGSTNLWLIRASGGEPTRITKGVGPDIGVRVSADGKTLLYLQRRPIGHIWIGNLDKGGARQVTHEDLVLGAPVLSPDLQRIAVPILDPDPLRRAGGVFVMNLQGKERRQITPENVSPLSAHWSPDGRWIAYSATGGSASTDSALVCVVEAATPGTPRRVARGTLVKWIDDSTLYVVRRLQSGLVSVHTGLERETSPDSTYRVPLRGGYSLVTDFRRGREGWWLQPAGPQESPGAGPRFVAPLSLPILGGAPDRSFLLCIDEDGKPFKIVLPSGRRVPIQAALPGLSSQSLVGIAWDNRTITYLNPGVTSKLVVIENLK